MHSGFKNYLVHLFISIDSVDPNSQAELEKQLSVVAIAFTFYLKGLVVIRY